MKKSELAALSLKQLVALQAELTPLIEAKRQEEHASLRAKLAKMAEDAGFRLEAVLNDGTRKSTRKLPTVAVKYRNPKNVEETWTGRGRMPRWMTAAIGQTSKTKDDFLVV